MSIKSILIPERARKTKGFAFGRILPFRKKNQVGPFTFIDHLSPIELNGSPYMDIDQHPHIGLCTLTYMFEGKLKRAP